MLRHAATRLVFLIAAVAALGLAVPALADSGRVPKPQFSTDKTTTCVLPRDEMRRTHMDLLKHRRDKTVHEGIRGGKVSLAACVECHADKTTGSVIGSPTAFCQSCHTYAAVKLDCFECHQSKAGGQRAASAAVKP